MRPPSSFRAARRPAAGVAALLVTAWSPPLRDAVVALEPVLAPGLFLLGLTAGVTDWVRRHRRDDGGLRAGRRLEAQLARLLDGWGWPLAVLAFLAPLWSEWQQGPIKALTAYSAFLGHIPFGDAHGHFEGATRLIHEGHLNAFSERRPLNATWLATVLAASGRHLPLALVVQAVVLATSAYWASRVVGIRVGLFPALAFFGIVLGLFRPFVVGVLTEPLAASFACLALAILLSGAARTSLTVLATGVLCLDAALRTRPGAQFLLLLLMAWGVFVMRGRRLRAAVVAVTLALAGMAHTAALNRLYGSGEASATSYAAFTLYGLARGSNYEQGWTDFRSQLERLPNEDARARFLYARAFESIRQEPRLLLLALARNELEFLDKLRRDLSRLTSPGTFEDAAEERIRPTPRARERDRLLGGAVLLVVAAGFGLHLVRSRRSDRVFWLAVFAGLLASAPFVFGDTGLRALSAGLPFLALALASGISTRPRRPASLPGRRLERRGVWWAAVTGLAILGACAVGPAIARRLGPTPDGTGLHPMSPGRDALVEIPTCPAVLVSDRGPTGLALPRVDGRELDEALNLAGATQDEGLRQVRLPAVVLSCYDRVSKQQLLLVASHNRIKRAGRLEHLVLHPLPGDPRFLEVEDRE